MKCFWKTWYCVSYSCEALLSVAPSHNQVKQIPERFTHTYSYMTPCWSSFLDLVYLLFIFKLFSGFIYRHSEEWQESRVREGKGGKGLQLAALHHHTAARSSLWADSFINVHFVPQSVSFYSSVTSFGFHSIRPSLCTLLRTLYSLSLRCNTLKVSIITFFYNNRFSAVTVKTPR